MVESQIAHSNTLPKQNWYDIAALAATLNAKQVPYLRSTTEAEPLNISLPTLIATLAQHQDPRVRESLIPLFLRHPSVAQHVPGLAATLPKACSQTLRHFYTAAAYLQRLWRGTLGIYLGAFSLLPDYFGQAEFRLPHPNEHFGELGLRVLANFFTEKTGDNWLSTYESVMSLTLAQLEMEIDDGN